MPDISPTASRRDPQDDPFYDAPPDLARKNEIVRLNAPTIPGASRPVDPAPPTLPETPTAKLNVRAFANPALGGTPKPPGDTKGASNSDITQLCEFAHQVSGAAERAIDVAKLSSCVQKDGACLSPENAKLVADLCAPPPPPPYSGPSAGVETGRGVSLDALQKQQEEALSQQLSIEKSVATDPLAALLAPAVIAAGGTRETLYNETRLADGGWALLAARADGAAAAQERATLVTNESKSVRK